MAAKKDDSWDASLNSRDRDSIHVYVECEENDGYDDELDFEEEIPLELASLAPTDEWSVFNFYFLVYNSPCPFETPPVVALKALAIVSLQLKLGQQYVFVEFRKYENVTVSCTLVQNVHNYCRNKTSNFNVSKTL